MWLWAWLAWAGAQDAETLRLLGPEPAGTPAPVAAPAAPSGPTIPWPLGLGALGLAALWWGRGKLNLGTLSKEPELKVVGRTALGGRAGLAVIEVRAAEGAWRRLVVGTGDGAPRLVADLGLMSFDEVFAQSDEAVPQAPAVVPLAPPVARPVRGATLAPPHAEPPVRDDARSLVSEVLGERKKTRSTMTTLA